MFRSKVAEALFNKYNRNKKIKTKSAGAEKKISPVPLTVNIMIKLRGAKIKDMRPKKFNEKILKEADKIIIVADDIPESIFKKYKKKITNWKIPDIHGNIFAINDRMNKIDKKVLNLVRELDN